MKIISVLAGICALPLILLADGKANAKGSCSSHGHFVAHSHSSRYYNLYKLRDSNFPGYVVTRHDTLRGTLSKFGSSSLLLVQEDGHRRDIWYSKIEVLHLDEPSGVLYLTQCPGHSGFYRLLVNSDSLALYDQRFKPHISIADVDTNNLLFRYKDFSRNLGADFHNGLRKRIVPIINAHYATAVTTSSSKKEVYRIMEQGR